MPPPTISHHPRSIHKYTSSVEKVLSTPVRFDDAISRGKWTICALDEGALAVRCFVFMLLYCATE